MKKIYGEAAIRAAYERGEISRSTMNRGLRRGWVCVGYMKPHAQGGDTSWFKDQDKVSWVMTKLKNIASKIVRVYGRVYNEADVDDLVSEALIYLYERQEPFEKRNRFLAVAKSYIKHAFTKGRAYRSRAYSSTSREIEGGEFFKYLSEGLV